MFEELGIKTATVADQLMVSVVDLRNHLGGVATVMAKMTEIASNGDVANLTDFDRGLAYGALSTYDAICMLLASDPSELDNLLKNL